MWNYYKKRMSPARYQGKGARKPYFEGWYYKLVSPGGKHRLAVIPGIYRSKNITESHAFVQVLDGVRRESWYTDYPVDSFSFDEDRFQVGVGDNRFWDKGMDLNLKTGDINLKGKLRFDRLQPWPVSLRSPGIMGWYAWVPFMQCFHGIVSLDHEISGILELNGNTLDLTRGRGYIEKDWGRSFPRSYIWMQCNHFATPGTSFTGSVAHIPWIFSSFTGFITGLLYDGHLYRFATYNGSEIVSIRHNESTIDWVIRRRELLLEVRATRGSGGHLQAPGEIAMDRRVAESMDAVLEVRLTRGGNILFEEEGKYGGVEVSNFEFCLPAGRQEF